MRNPTRWLCAGLACAALLVGIADAAEKKLKKEKLQIVFLFGQSNMVGLSDVRTAWYLTQPQYIPPRDVATMKTRFFDWNFYWSGVNYYEGPQKQEALELAGTVDVVNTAPYYPLEFDLLKQVRDNTEKDSPEYQQAMTMSKRATSNAGFHYHGSSKCFLLMGDAMGRSLANLMAGGEPTINAMVKE